MSFLELSKKRYSCRKMSEQEVSKEQLERILEAGRIAPTAVNKQPFHIYVMDSEKAKEVIHESTECTFNANTFVVVASKPQDAWTRKFDGANFADVDASIVATHIMLAIEDEGLATTWVGWFDPHVIQDAYPAMKDEHLIAIFPIGHGDMDPSPRHADRKTMEELVTKL